MRTRCRSTFFSRDAGNRHPLALPTICLLLAGTGAFSGCVAADGQANPLSPVAPGSAAPTPSAEPAPLAAVLPPPPQVLSGDCSELFSDEVVSGVLGVQVTTREFFMDSPNAQAVPTLGGISCEWTTRGSAAALPVGAEVTRAPAVSAASDRAETMAAAPLHTPSLNAVVLSAVVLSSNIANVAPGDVSCQTGVVIASTDNANACRFSVTAGGLWLSGTLYASAETAEDDMRTVVAMLTDLFTMRPAGQVADPAIPAAAWARPSCGNLSATADVASTLGSPDLVAGDVETSGGEAAPGVHAAHAGAGVFACAWHHSGVAPAGQLDGFSVQGLPGGAWVRSSVLALPGASVVQVPGVELAVRVPMAAGLDTLDVFDGVNWLQIARTDGLEPVLPVLPGLLDALNTDSVG